MFTNAVVILWYLNLLQNSVWSLFTNNCGHEWSNIKTKALSTTVSFYVWFILLHRVLITHDLYFNMVSSLKRERVSFMLVCQKDFLNIIIVSYIVNFPNSFTSTCSLHPSYLTPNIFRITHTHTTHGSKFHTLTLTHTDTFYTWLKITRYASLRPPDIKIHSFWKFYYLLHNKKQQLCIVFIIMFRRCISYCEISVTTNDTFLLR